MAGEIQRFDFHGHDVRITDQQGEPWWLLTDLCEALGYSNPSITARMVRRKYQSNISLDSGGKPAIIVNEAGMNQLVMRSRKPEAEQFQDWIYEEVLPTIRKTGQYAVAIRPPDTMIETVSVVATALVPALTTAMTQAMTPLVTMLQQQHEMVQTLVKAFIGEPEQGMLPQHTQYITIEGWCRVRGVALDFGSKQTFGKRATAFCKEHGVKRGTVPDERYGRVGSYPIEVLDELWKIDEEQRALWAK